MSSWRAMSGRSTNGAVSRVYGACGLMPMLGRPSCCIVPRWPTSSLMPAVFQSLLRQFITSQ